MQALLSAVKGYVQQVDHVAARGNAEAAGLDVGSCWRQRVRAERVATLVATPAGGEPCDSYVWSPLC